MSDEKKLKKDYAWHSLANDFLYQFFETTYAGLSDQEVQKRWLSANSVGIETL